MNRRIFVLPGLAHFVFFIFTLPSIASAITVVYPGASLGLDMFGRPGSLFPGNGVNLSGNTVIVNSGTIPGNVYGGMTSGLEDISDNLVLIRDGDVGSGAYPISGLAHPGIAASTVDGSTITGGGPISVNGLPGSANIGSSVYGGASNGGDVFNNTVIISGGTVNQDVAGGFVPTGLGQARGNQIEISGGAVLGRVTGGSSRSGGAADNIVIISSGDIGGDVYGGTAIIRGDATGNSILVTGGHMHSLVGGYSTTGNAISNLVTLSGLVNPNAVFSSSIYGGHSGGGTAADNSILIENSPGLKTGTLAGGRAAGDAVGNSLTIINSPLNNGNMFGGIADSGAAVNNTVTILNSLGLNTVALVGGSSGNGAAAGNRVIMDNSSVNSGNIFGGIAGGGNDATGNTVSISNSPSLVGNDIYGGRASIGNADNNGVSIIASPSFNAHGIVGGMTFFGSSAANNSVTIADSPNFTVTGVIYGGFANFATYKPGNTLNLFASDGAVGEINSFQNYNFYLPNNLANGQTLVTITSTIPTDMLGSNVAITGVEGGGEILAPGNSVVLIGKAAGLTDFQAKNVPKGIALLYDFDVSTADGSLRATLQKVQKNPASDIIPNGPGAGLVIINHYAELIDGLAAARLLEPEERRKGPSVYVRATGGAYRYKADADVDVSGMSILAGVDWGLGNLTLGAFVETGFGNYTSKYQLDRLPTVKGDGDINYYGGGILGFLSLPEDFYLEASMRAGIVNTDFNSDNMHFIGHDISYDLSSPYYGAHAGVGWLPQLSDTVALDIYTKYLWVRQMGDDTEILGDHVEFDASNSQRWRTGARLSYTAFAGFTPYIGAAIDYEFDSEIDARIEGQTVSAHSLKGGTGIGEIGVTYKLNNGLYLDLAVKGLVGERKGVLGAFTLGYDF